jgi:CO/xanthine dehydrogenase Mo-binding subunit
MRDGNALVGWGMATGIWEAMQESASAKASLTDDGMLTVSSATADIGTGTYTIMTQIAAEALGLPISNARFVLGDSTLPMAPIEGGSWTAASVGSAVQARATRSANASSSSPAGSTAHRSRPQRWRTRRSATGACAPAAATGRRCRSPTS